MKFDEVYTKDYLDQLLAATLKVAPIIYNTKARNLRHLEELDDFTQEALVHVSRLFEQRYIVPFDETKGTVENLVSSLLSGTFILTRYNILTRDNYRHNVKLTHPSVGNDYGVVGFGRDIMADYNTPEVYHNVDIGKTVLYNIAEKALQRKLGKQTKHTYVGVSSLMGEFDLSEYNVFIHLINGYSMIDIVEMFQYSDYKLYMTQANTVRKVINRALKKVRDYVNENLGESEVYYIEEYLRQL